MYSADLGNTWKESNPIITYCNVISYKNGIWLAGAGWSSGSKSMVSYSGDGVNWNPSTGLEKMGVCSCIEWGSTTGTVYCGGDISLALSSDGGMTWSIQQSFGSYKVNCMVLMGTLLVVGTTNGIVYGNPSSGWTQVKNISTYNVVSLCWNGNKLIAGCSSATLASLLYSTDGMSWIVVQPSITDVGNTITNIRSISYSDALKRWLASCYDNVGVCHMIYSDNLNTWASCNDQPFNHCNNVKWVRNSYMASGYGGGDTSTGLLCYSTDGINWYSTQIKGLSNMECLAANII